MPRLPKPPRLLRVCALAAVLAIVVYYSLLDAPPVAFEPSPWYDKELHFVAYTAVTVTAAGATIELRARRRYRIGIVIAFATAFGVGIELVQWPLADRYASMADVVANAAGTAVGAGWFLVESRFGYVGDSATEDDGQS
ncbi:VanZ family protein [Halorubellus litoreus]|uniref:VanZ family protein n=1 Tax=Halorubellus litoreus TaxID=755308 RepID=A0ABD5VHA5_9EURY